MRQSVSAFLAVIFLAGPHLVLAQPPSREAGDAEAGREAYAAECRACHSGAIAPTLKGVVGRPVAGADGYAYSDGLKAKAGVAWTPQSLNAYIAAPQAWAPGSKMPLAVADAQKRVDIIAYLITLGGDG